MSTRITVKTLQSIVDRLNKLTNSPLEAYTRTADGKLSAKVGHFHISGAYGGYSLHRMVNESGGVSDFLSCGHVNARSLADRLYAFERGLAFNASKV